MKDVKVNKSSKSTGETFQLTWEIEVNKSDIDSYESIFELSGLLASRLITEASADHETDPASRHFEELIILGIVANFLAKVLNKGEKS